MHQNSHTILGIDPGTTVTGFAVIETTHQFDLLDFGCIRPPAKYKLSDRYLIIHDATLELLEKYSPKAVSIETQFVSRNPQSAIKLGMARGVIVLAARKMKVAVFEYAPKKAKLAVTGNGNASKYQIQQMMKQLFNLKEIPQPEDAADALALALCHANASKMGTSFGAPL